MEKRYILAPLISVCLVDCVATNPQPAVTVPAVVQSQFKSALMYGSTAICKATVPLDEFAKRKADGDIVETVTHEGWIYFLTRERFSEPMPGGGHADGVMISGVYRTKMEKY